MQPGSIAVCFGSNLAKQLAVAGWKDVVLSSLIGGALLCLLGLALAGDLAVVSTPRLWWGLAGPAVYLSLLLQSQANT
jgi:hypothetical protein